MSTTFIDTKGIRKGYISGQKQYYHVLGTDKAMNQVVMTFWSELYHTESLEKAFRRLNPVHHGKETEQTE